MKLHYTLLTLFFALSSPLFAGGWSLIDVYQPTNRLGTEKADPVIVSRPVIVGNNIFEGALNAISLPHRIAGAPKEFPEESNLIVLVGANFRVLLLKDGLTIMADFSKAKDLKKSEITVPQVMKMSALCLQKTLSNYSQEPIPIIWIAPEGVSLVDENLPLEIKKVENKSQ